MSNMHVKSGDTVMVISGADAGKKGKVQKAFPETGRVIVEGVNIVKKHQKPADRHARRHRRARSGRSPPAR